MAGKRGRSGRKPRKSLPSIPAAHRRAARGPIGRPRTVISEADWRTIAAMAGDGCTHEEIADYLGVAKSTLQAPHLRERMAEVTRAAWAATKWKVRKVQLKSALGGQPVAQIWWGKQHLAQTDRQQLTGANGGPLEFTSSALEKLAESIEAVVSKKREDEE